MHLDSIFTHSILFLGLFYVRICECKHIPKCKYPNSNYSQLSTYKQNGRKNIYRKKRVFTEMIYGDQTNNFCTMHLCPQFSYLYIIFNMLLHLGLFPMCWCWTTTKFKSKLCLVSNWFCTASIGGSFDKFTQNSLWIENFSNFLLPGGNLFFTTQWSIAQLWKF